MHGWLDLEFLDELLEGDQEFAAELFEAYTQSADSSYAEACQLIQSGDVLNAYRPFHTLKGASASVGLLKVQEMATDLETKAKEANLQECQLALPTLAKLIAEAKKALQAYLNSLS